MVDAISLKVTKTINERLTRLAVRDPIALQLPGFSEFLRAMENTEGAASGVSPDTFDAIHSLWFLLQVWPDTEESIYDEMLDVIVGKIRAKGGFKVSYKQIPDIVYEGQVYLLLADCVPGIQLNPEAAAGAPDLTFSVWIHGIDQPYRVAIECKNISTSYEHLRNLVRKAADAIQVATNQYHSRTEVYSDHFIFLDLPYDILLRTGDDYIRLCINVQRELRLRGVTTSDEARVVFTAFSKRGMDKLAQQDKFLGGSVMQPVVTRDPVVPFARAFLINSFFRRNSPSVNILNFGRVAVRVDDPEAYYLD